MSAVASYVDEMLNVRGWTTNLRMFATIFPEPVAKTLQIIEKSWDPPVPPFRFAASGVTLTFLFNSILNGEQQTALQGMAEAVAYTLFSLVYLAVTYKIFRDVSKSARTYGDFLTLAGIITGIYGYLLAGTAIVAFVDPSAGLASLAFTGIYMLVLTFRSYSVFWQMSYGNIIMYSVLAYIASIVVVVGLWILLGGTSA